MKKPNNLGHRSRVRQKFLTSLGEELHEYELLEILLFASSSRQDTKAIAKKLIAKFGDISAVIDADIEILQEIEGVGEAAIVQIKLIANIIKRILKKSSQQKIILDNWQDLLNYAFILLKNRNNELFHVLFFNKKHQLLEDLQLNSGESDFVIINAKEIAKKSLNISASSVVLLHNHPSGEVKASKADIVTTNEIVAMLKPLEIRVLDHIIIAQNNYFSFKEEGLL